MRLREWRAAFPLRPGCSLALASIALGVAMACAPRRWAPAHSPEPKDDPDAIGRATPTTLVQTDRHSRWLFYCQARRDTDRDGKLEVTEGSHGQLFGDELTGYLRLRDEELRIDAVVAQSPDGDWLVVADPGGLVLHDVARGTSSRLKTAPYRRTTARRVAAPRSAAFDRAGERVAYLRDGSPHAVAVRTLDTAQETVFTLPHVTDRALRVAFDDDGRHLWVLADAVPTRHGPTHDGLLRDAALHDTSCERDASSYYLDGEGVAGKTIAMLATLDGPPRFVPQPGALGLAGGQVVGIAANGALWLRDGAETITIAPSTCAPEVVYSDDAGRIAYVCVDPGSVFIRQGPLFLFDGSRSRASGKRVRLPTHFRPPHQLGPSGRLIELEDGGWWDVLLQMPVPPPESPPRSPVHVLGRWRNTELFVLKNGEPWIRDSLSDERTRVPTQVRLDTDFDGYGFVSDGAHVVARVDATRTAVIDVASRRLRGCAPPLDVVRAIASDGRVLVSASPGRIVFQGPLRWEDPVACEPRSP